MDKLKRCVSSQFAYIAKNKLYNILTCHKSWRAYNKNYENYLDMLRIMRAHKNFSKDRPLVRRKKYLK